MGRWGWRGRVGDTRGDGGADGEVWCKLIDEDGIIEYPGSAILRLTLEYSIDILMNRINEVGMAICMLSYFESISSQ